MENEIRIEFIDRESYTNGELVRELYHWGPTHIQPVVTYWETGDPLSSVAGSDYPTREAALAALATLEP